MSVLHTVNKSPFENSALRSCLDHTNSGDAILLFEDAVYGAVKGTSVTDCITSPDEDVLFFALGPDLTARGIDEASVLDVISVVDYAGFVDLVTRYDVTQAWL